MGWRHTQSEYRYFAVVEKDTEPRFRASNWKFPKAVHRDATALARHECWLEREIKRVRRGESTADLWSLEEQLRETIEIHRQLTNPRT